MDRSASAAPTPPPATQAFDADLRARDARWGVRDLEWLQELAADSGLALEERVEMPANNQTLIFRKAQRHEREVGGPGLRCARPGLPAAAMATPPTLACARYRGRCAGCPRASATRWRCSRTAMRCSGAKCSATWAATENHVRCTSFPCPSTPAVAELSRSPPAGRTPVFAPRPVKCAAGGATTADSWASPATPPRSCDPPRPPVWVLVEPPWRWQPAISTPVRDSTTASFAASAVVSWTARTATS